MAILMEYLFTPWDNMLEREQQIKEKFPDFLLPGKVADALKIIGIATVKRKRKGYQDLTREIKGELNFSN